MLVSQVLLLLAIGFMGSLEPKAELGTVAIMAFLVAFFSATQDVALDAYRRELLPAEELGFGTSVHVTAYRVSGLVPGSLALILADHMPWSTVFWITAAFMLVGWR